ncbi:unnamed protein product [Ceutorhynchus assimilis]|uniref:Glutamate receptor ionotropic, kainate 2 n=1 Tax=Ceutorhynchus assimilis TaxID=467358 RepID=A0A9N9MR57_9CUCU|nr:unnamed protein product [Ceutorhynchus assimilis]
MGVRYVFWSFWVYWLYCLGVSGIPINIDSISHKDENLDGINWDVLTDKLEGYEVATQNIILQEKDWLRAANSLCDAAAQENGVTAIFGPENKDLASAIDSVASYIGVPYIHTDWMPRHSKLSESTLNFYPEATLLSRAYGAIIESLDWATFAIVYENEESLIKMQEVIKLQEHEAKINKNKIVLKRLDENGDNRHVFKDIRNTSIFCIVLDCSSERIIEVLGQAKEVKVLDDLNTNIFITSLDAHTLDYTSLQTKANITTVRLFDPTSYHVQKQVIRYYPEISPQQLTVKMALMNDAMLLLAESLNALKSTHGEDEIVYEPLFCNAAEKYSDKYGLMSKMHETEIVGGITGDFILKDGIREQFELSIIPINNMDKPIGIWNADNPNVVFLTRNATEREAELQKRLQSHNFIVTSRIGSPYLYDRKDAEAVGNARYYGYSIDLIAEIAKLLNITFEFQITKDNAYLNLQKDLIERKADLAICDFTITPQRREVIDFSMPFMSLGIGILHKTVTEDEEVKLYGFLGPLSSKVWFYIGALYLFISFVLVLIARMSTEDWENPHPCEQSPSELENMWDLKNCCWLTLGSITTQGCDILPKGGFTRLATASWWFFSLIITSSYTANLAAFLTMSKKDDSIKTVEELATQSKVKFGCLNGGATASFFQYSNNSLYQRMWNTMINEKPSVFEESNLKGMERVQSTKNALYAFFMESTGIEYEMERKCELKRIGDLLDSKSYGIGMPMNAEYRHSINAAVLKLQETGKLGELKEKWWKIERDGEPCPPEIPVNTDALALVNVGGVFIVLGVGIALAFFIATLEFLWNTYNVALEEHITYLEALKIEVSFACNVFVTEKRVKPLISETSSAKSKNTDETKTKNGLLLGAGSFLNVNASIINRIGSISNVEEATLHSAKSESKQGTYLVN